MRPGGLGDAEVEHARDAVGADEDVLRRDVAVDDAERLALARPSPRARRGARGATPHDDRDDDARRTRGPASARRDEAATSDSPWTYSITRKSSPSSATTSSVGTTFGCRMRAASARLVEEHRDELGVLRELRVQALDRDGAREARRPEQAPEVHRRHPARRDLVVDGVPPEESRHHRAPELYPIAATWHAALCSLNAMPNDDDEVGTELLPIPRTAARASAVLRVEGRGIERRLDAGTCQVGSGPDNNLVIDDRTVSRTHATFTLSPRKGVVVEDKGSSNGTLYLGQRIEKAVLALGARVQLGSVTVSIEPDTEALLDHLQYDASEYRGMVGKSSRMRKLFALLQRLEGSIATVLIEGESGVGKECVARAVHQGSPLAQQRMVTINCGSIARDLVASELFGHRRGAFTGAVDNRKGAFEQADGGTLFLDEVGELPLDVQPALLRALEVGEIRPVGADEARHVKVRIIAASNRNLEAEVSLGRFREDLFYRLAVVRVQVPPLRARPEDIETLALHFAHASGITLPPHVLEDLKTRAWPGNARELRNAIESYGVVGDLGQKAQRRLEREVDVESVDPTEPYQEQKDRVVEEFTKAYFRALLRYTNGNQAAAARIARLDRTYVGRLMTKYGLSVRKVP